LQHLKCKICKMQRKYARWIWLNYIEFVESYSMSVCPLDAKSFPKCPNASSSAPWRQGLGTDPLVKAPACATRWDNAAHDAS
jgi:hypothetical protein